MLGAIAGDIIGSVFEYDPIKTTDFPLFSQKSTFTDDTVLTIATAYAILRDVEYSGVYKDYGHAYPNAGYGSGFNQWFQAASSLPYNSWGNGSAMRVSPVGFAFPSMDEVLEQAEASAEVTHNHPEGIKGAQATALAIFLARMGETKETIRKELIDRFEYDLFRSLDSIRPNYRYDISCQGTVPEAFIAFYESESYEGAIRNAVSLGGDSDTLACITGGIAQAFFGSIPDEIKLPVMDILPEEFIEIIEEFNRKYPMDRGSSLE